MKRRPSIPHETISCRDVCLEKLVWLGTFCFGLAFLPCHAAEEPAAALALPTVQVADKAVKLDDWLVIGPFMRSDEKQALAEDFLRKMVADEPIGTAAKFDLKHWLATGQVSDGGKPENSLPSIALSPGDAVASMTAWLQHSIHPTAASAASDLAADLPPRTVTTGRDFINLPYAVGLGPQVAAKAGDQTDPGASAAAGLYYSACMVHATKPATVYFMLGCDSPFVLSLNGSRVNLSEKSTSDQSRTLLPCNFSYELDLAAGDNLLLLRIDNRGGDAGIFSARLEPTKAAASRFALDNDCLTLSSVVLTAGQPLPIRVRGAPSADLLQAEIVSFDGGHVANAGSVGNVTRTWDSAGTAPGPYKVRIRFEGATFEKPFYLMKPGAQPQDLVSGLDSSHLNEEQKIDLTALQTRMEILCRPENWHPADGEWQRKIVFTLGEIKSITDRIKVGREPIKDVPGLHLRGFVSAIDGQTEYYRIFVPNVDPAIRAQGLPIVLIMPTAVSATRTFIESPFVAHQVEAETLSALAEKKGCALLWVGFRSQPSGSPCDFAHFNEVLDAVEQDYRIDDRRIYLTGECGGGTLALMYDVKYPDRFAATGLINAYFHDFKGRHAADDLFWPIPAYQHWLQETDPVPAVLQSVRPSLLVMHDGTAEAGHGELHFSLDFAAEAKAAGYPFTFSQLPPTLHYHLEAWSDMLDWLLPQRLSDQRKALRALTDSRPGPISRAFAGPFILVEGTGGTIDDQSSIQSLSRSFQNAWQKTHFGPCRVAKDRDLSGSQKAANNLILLGNPSTNCIWREIEGRVPAKIAADGVLMGAKKWSGSALSVQALFPNPYNPARLAVVIGGSDLAAARFGTLDLSIDGWYDFGIWRTRDGASELVVADRYADAANFKDVAGPVNQAPPLLHPSIPEKP
jgi:pimeloyl-ACP methyl ester carboxylesterase